MSFWPMLPATLPSLVLFVGSSPHSSVTLLHRAFPSIQHLCIHRLLGEHLLCAYVFLGTSDGARAEGALSGS